MATGNHLLKQMAVLLLQELLDSLSPKQKKEPLQEVEAISTMQQIIARSKSQRVRDSPEASSAGASEYQSPDLPYEESVVTRSRSREKVIGSSSRVSKTSLKKIDSKPVKAHRARELHQRLGTNDWKFPHPIPNSVLVVDNIYDHGRGVKTTTPNIPAGTLLLIEKPLINKLKTSPKATYNERLESVVLGLGDEEKEIFAQLAWNDAADVYESRVKPNGFDITTDSLSVYRYISFINHSCKPNCRLEGGLQKDTFLVRTMVPIQEAGTEITIDYWPERRLDDANTRKEELNDGWGFICSCEACLDPEGSDRARRSIKELQALLRCKMEEYTPKELPDLAIINENMAEYLKLLQEEHFIDGISQAHRRAIQVYQKSSRPIDVERALVHRGQLVDLQRTLKGSESEEALKAGEDYIKALRAWRTSKAQITGKNVSPISGDKIKTGRVGKSINSSQTKGHTRPSR
jgi:hypothetical protein